MNLFPIYHLVLDCNIFDAIDNVLTFAALCLAYWQFKKQSEANRELQKKQNEENRKLQKQQNEKNWYISVIVIPQMDNINAMFSSLIAKVKDEHHAIVAGSRNLVLVAQKQKECKSLIASYMDHIVQLVGSYDRTTGNRVSEIEMDLQDEATNILDRESISEDDIRTKLLKYNGLLASSLFQCSKKDC